MFIDDHSLPPNLWKGKVLLDMLAPGEELSTEYFTPIWRSMLEVHSAEYVSGVLDCTTTNGYGDKDRAKNKASLENVFSFVAAAHHALEHGIAFSPSAGFHHAKYTSGGGYCTFNGLMIAAASILDLRYNARILILDGDAHYGDGCADIIARRLPKLYYHHSRHRNSIKDMLSLPWDLVMYQAGADAHEDDIYGAGTLTTEQFEARDNLVFSTCKARQIPIVWNLAGGYGAPNIEDSINLHYSTYLTARKIFWE